jgi:hypothetical protein
MAMLFCPFSFDPYAKEGWQPKPIEISIAEFETAYRFRQWAKPVNAPGKAGMLLFFNNIL